MSRYAKTRIIAGVIVAICCLPMRVPAEPLSIRVEASDAGNHATFGSLWDVYLEGEIDTGATERMRQALVQIGSDRPAVYFDSRGGSLADGLNIGGMLRRLGAVTIVGKQGAGGSGVEPGVCLSACSMAFLGGVYRHVPNGSVLGVHRVSAPVSSAQAFEAGQIVAARVSGYIREMGIDSRLFDRMASTAADQIYILSLAELRSLHIENNGRQPAKWWSEPTDQGMSLIGMQEAAAGIGKSIFSCVNGVVVFHSVFQAGNNAKQIASGQWVHSLMIDDATLPLDAPYAIEDAEGFLNATFDLSPDQAYRIVGASSVGHAMQGGRSDPAFLGYKIEIDADAAKRVKGFMESCTSSR